MVKATVKRSALALLVAACVLDPVTEERADDLGDEAPGIPPGPRHRAGQPCLACHDNMAVAGTIYAVRGSKQTLAGVTVTLTDVSGATKSATTNDVGNFFVDKREWSPTFPLHAAVSFGRASATMSSIIGQDGSCATCHADPASRISAGAVYVAPTAELLDGGAP